MKKNLFLLLASFLMLMGAKAERLPVNATHGGSWWKTRLWSVLSLL